MVTTVHLVCSINLPYVFWNTAYHFLAGAPNERPPRTTVKHLPPPDSFTWSGRLPLAGAQPLQPPERNPRRRACPGNPPRRRTLHLPPPAEQHRGVPVFGPAAVGVGSPARAVARGTGARGGPPPGGARGGCAWMQRAWGGQLAPRGRGERLRQVADAAGPIDGRRCCCCGPGPPRARRGGGRGARSSGGGGGCRRGGNGLGGG